MIADFHKELLVLKNLNRSDEQSRGALDMSYTLCRRPQRQLL